jgi:hypothetical protein
LVYCPEEGGGLRIPFIYLGRGLINPDAIRIIAYTPLIYFDGDGVDALYGDGHCEWIAAADLSKELARWPSTGATTAQSRPVDDAAQTDKDRP